MSLKFLNILNEEKESCKYQIRDIGGDVYYKKCKGNSKWIFTDEVDFLKNSKKSNIERMNGIIKEEWKQFLMV